MAKILNHQNSHKLKAEAAAAAPSPVVVVEHHQRHRQQGAREERDGQAAVTYPQAHTTKIGLETFPQTFHCRNLQQKQPKKSHHESQPNDGQQQHGKGQQQQHCSHINTNTKQAQLLPQLTKTTTTTMQQKVPAQHLQAVAGKTNNNYKSIVEPASKTYNSTTMPSSSSASSSCSSSLAGPNSPSASSSPTSPSLYLPQLWPPSSTLYSNYSCCVLTYNLFAAYAEAATLQLKRKTSLTKLFYAASGWGWTTTGVRRHNDMSSICYLILMAFVYWGVMIRAAVATNLSSNTTSSSSSSASSSSSSVSSTTTLNTTLQHVSEISGNEEFALNSIAKLFVLNPKEIPQNTNHTADLITGNSVNSQMESLLPFLSFSSSSSSSASSSASSSSPVSPDILSNYQRRLLTRREAANVPDFEDDDSSYHDDEFDEYETLIRNKSAKGKYIGAPCNNMSCEPTLLHVTCDKETQICGCERGYPVQIGLTRGCDKPKKLGEMCFYDETCQFNDENSLCVQVRHNAMCQCVKGYHSVSLNKPTRRVFCTPDLDELNSDLPTLLGVCVGIGVLAGLICMVLHLFSKTKYPRHRNFGDANLPPPIMYSSETVQSGRPSSRSSIRSSGGSIGSYGNRRSSTGGVTSTTAGSKGILVSTSRTGAARSAAILLISCHLSTLSKQSLASRATSRQTSGAGCSANSRDNLDENGSDPGSRSCDSTLSMTRHLQKQLNHQRQLLSFELSPAKTKNHDRVRALLGLNGIENINDEEEEMNSLDNGHLVIGALPTPASETPRFAVNELFHQKKNETKQTSQENHTHTLQKHKHTHILSDFYTDNFNSELLSSLLQ